MSSNSSNYDVIIIGAGPSGIFCAYELIQQKPDLKILMVEKGRRIERLAWDASHVPSPPVLPERVHFPTASCHSLQTWAGISRRFWGMTRQWSS